MMITTLAAFSYQLYSALVHVNPETGAGEPNWFLAAVISVLIVLGLVVFWEGAKTLRTGPATVSTEDPVISA